MPYINSEEEIRDLFAHQSPFDPIRFHLYVTPDLNKDGIRELIIHMEGYGPAYAVYTYEGNSVRYVGCLDIDRYGGVDINKSTGEYYVSDGHMAHFSLRKIHFQNEAR